jgi:para-aminobenzoate synthetase/4-amino-4-deoxychorismate lyase
MAVPKRHPMMQAPDEIFVLLDDNSGSGGDSALFRDPVGVLIANAPEDIAVVFDGLERARRGGLHAAGFMAYELGHLLEPRLSAVFRPDEKTPLMWFALFRARERLDRRQTQRFIEGRIRGIYSLGPLRPRMSQGEYAQRVAAAQQCIARGEVYQLNLTFKSDFAFEGDPLALYADLRRKQRVPHGALIAAPGFHVLSLSPELFLRVRDGIAETRPMKGTAPRGFHAAEDERLARWLAGDVKSRAENLMIVDLMRNDLGRVAELGSVGVTDLFTVETYQTVLQMTSGVRARLREDVRFEDLVRATFPPGSITGAPKLKAMQILARLETGPRGVYTGAIGAIEPNGDCLFNVAIRTLVLTPDGRGEAGVGSGIVQDSVPEAEHAECLLKLRFLSDPLPDFDLIETLRFEAGEGYFLLEEHLARLAASAERFGFDCDIAEVKAALLAHAAGLNGAYWRVRLTLDARGRIDITATPMEPPGPGAVMRFAIAETRMNSRNPFLYHKTTRRDFYDRERERLAPLRNCREVVFLNERGEVTEGSFTNVFVAMNGLLLTPKLTSGLLDGTLRRRLVADGMAREARLTLRDLAEADGIWLGNSVRGLVRGEPADAFLMEASAMKGALRDTGHDLAIGHRR